MPPLAPIQQGSDHYSWKQGVGAMVFWFFASILVGVIAAALNGEHGSVVFVGLGVAVGIAGALCHNLLLAAPKYRQLSASRKVLTLWSGTMLVLLCLAAATVPNWDQPYFSALKEAVSLLAAYCSLPALLATPVAVHLVESAA